jgi:hypothetical protein
MAVTLNASTSSGFVQTADTSGVLTLQNNGTDALSVSSGNLQFNSGYGSVATAYGCRAWVNFNGTGTVAINASGNVTSITDNGVGDYTINFTTAMPDINYSAQVSAQGTVSSYLQVFMFGTSTLSLVSPTTSGFRFWVANYNNGSVNTDSAIVTASVFR